MRTRQALGLAAALLAAGCAGGGSAPPRPVAVRPVATDQVSGTTALLQAVSPVNDLVAWASGHRATWLRTTDGGTTWHSGAMTGRDAALEFRDVHAVDAVTAYLLAAGPGERSRIYKTTDGGAHWQLQFQNRDSSAFYDCLAFWDATHGIAVSDAVGGRMIVMATEDGEHWTDASASLPPALPGEGAFAASGTCLVSRGRSHAWIGTGAQTGARVYHTGNRGRAWSVVTTPVMSGAGTGIATVAFRDERHGLALGGNVGDNNSRGDNVARTSDAGATWTLVSRPGFSGAVFGAAYVPGLGSTVVAAGPKGLEFSPDDGDSWTAINDRAYWAVAFASPRAGWAVGPGGRITRISFGP